jgi:septation ring formation regulator EzrA
LIFKLKPNSNDPDFSQVIAALEICRQEDEEYKASLGFMESHSRLPTETLYQNKTKNTIERKMMRNIYSSLPKYLLWHFSTNKSSVTCLLNTRERELGESYTISYTRRK